VLSHWRATRLRRVVASRKHRINFIADPDTCKNVAIIRDGAVFRDAKDGTKIAIVFD
jgi:hypothetical protein